VTMPGTYMRSRHSAAFYSRMGISDCIAGNREEYTDIAVRLACDKSFNDDVVRKIEKSREQLWKEDNVISEFTKFFQSAVSSYPEIIVY